MRKLSFLLALIMLLSVFTVACKTDGNSESSTESEEQSAPVKDNTKPHLTGVSVGKTPYQTVVSTGCSYKKSVEAGADYPDTYGSELTDGVFADPDAATYGDNAFSGYTISNTRLQIDIDLGCEYDTVYKFKVSFLSTTNAGIGTPSSMIAYVSVDGEKWFNVGNIIKPAYEENTIQVAEFTAKEYYKAHYVRFVIRSSSAWIFLDEVMAIADTEGAQYDVLYTDAIKDAYAKLGTVNSPKGDKDIDRSLTKTLISKGVSYASDSPAASEFPDPDSKLTDGKLSGFYEGETWVGYNANKDTNITVDLGKTVDDISSLELSCFANNAVGKYMPPAVKFTSVDEKGNKKDLGIVYGSTSVSKGNYIFVLPFEKAISARKIIFTLVSSESNMYLVEEAGVYAYRETTRTGVYPEVVIDKNCTEWASGDSKYGNLILNKNAQIIATTDPANTDSHYNTPVTSTLMTDGKAFDNLDIHCGNYFKFNGGASRMVIFDLEYISAVDKFTVSFLQRSEWAVNAPGNVNVLVSDDGEEWYKVGSIEPKGSSDPGIYTAELKLKNKVKARYIVFDFPTTGWVGCKELEAFGTKSTSGASAPEKLGYQKTSFFVNERKQPSDNILKGAKDLCLLYHGTRTEGYTTEQLIPYLAYVDEEGNPKDVMFDSFLFLLTGSLPSGSGGHDSCLASDCLFMIDDVFKDSRNMNALEEAAGIVKKELGLPSDYKYKVTMSIYYPWYETTNFGDIDGDGKDEDLSDMKTRLKVVKWYIDEFEKQFKDHAYENLEIVGYYWYNESINPKDDSIELLNGISKLCHSMDRSFFWIPYFTANGYNYWADYGFDVACMQPNYVFKLETPYSNIDIAAQYTKLYGMGVEMEICSEVLNNEQFYKRYMAYLAAGIEYGYMDDCIIMYYQSILDFYNATVSNTKYARPVYDYTYHFIKGDLQYKPEKIGDIEFNCNSNEIYTGTIPLVNDVPVQLRVGIIADHGTVTMNNNGTFDYYPEKDYKGDVKFCYQYSEYLGWSDLCNVTLHIN